MKTRSLLLILATAAAVLREPALAAEFTVGTEVDAVSGSLREAIGNAAPGDTIKFAPGLDGKTIFLTSGELLINKSLTIQGLGANRLAINGSGVSRVFNISGLSVDATVNLSGLLITNGFGINSILGGGIVFFGPGTLNLDRCEISGNVGDEGGGLGAYTEGDTPAPFLNLTDCSIVENTASGRGAGVFLQFCTVKMLNCTISENRNRPSSNWNPAGGGIWANVVNLDLENCTVARNKLTAYYHAQNGGIEVSNGEIKLRNTIVAGNEAQGSSRQDIEAIFVTSLGHNLVGINQVSGLAASDQFGTAGAPLDPKLGPLQYNGGPTRTHALLPGSPALDAGDDADLPLFDQRGVGYARKVGAQVDIGAFEASCGVPVVAITKPSVGSIYPVNTPVAFTGSFEAADASHTAQWNIDGNLAPATVNESNHTVSDTFTFAGPGVYSVKLNVFNACGNSASADSVADQSAMVVIYDPTAGFVTGGGWITSPAGAYAADAALTGKASFAFVSKYKKGATAPTGDTSFEFKVAGFNFASQNYDWLVVSGARAQYKGVGSVNGISGFGFMLTGIDGQLSGGGGTDKFRIKIWNIATSAIVYDNQKGAIDDAMPLAIGGGSIVIHK